MFSVEYRNQADHSLAEVHGYPILWFHKKTHLMIYKGLQQFLTARWFSDVSVEASSMHGGFTKYPSVGTGLSSAQYCSQGIQQKYLAAAYISQIHDGSVICVQMKQLTTIGLQHSDKM